MRPVVVAVNTAVMTDLVANPDEIAELFWLPLSTFTAPPVDYVFDRQVLGVDKCLHTPAWVVDDQKNQQIVWGLTARMLANLMQIDAGIEHRWYYRITDA